MSNGCFQVLFELWASDSTYENKFFLDALGLPNRHLKITIPRDLGNRAGLLMRPYRSSYLSIWLRIYPHDCSTDSVRDDPDALMTQTLNSFSVGRENCYDDQSDRVVSNVLNWVVNASCSFARKG